MSGFHYSMTLKIGLLLVTVSSFRNNNHYLRAKKVNHAHYVAGSDSSRIPDSIRLIQTSPTQLSIQSEINTLESVGKTEQESSELKAMLSILL
jgi:hypothetical protein